MVFCTTCGSKLEEQWIICPNCGTSLEKIDKPKQIIITPQQKTMTYQQAPNKKMPIKKRKTAKILMIISIVVLSALLAINIPASIITGNRYNSMVDKCNDLIGVLEDPLTDPATPTLDELFDWLAVDDTDENEWSMVWQCGDFAVMLMVRAKGQNKRLRPSILNMLFLQFFMIISFRFL